MVSTQIWKYWLLKHTREAVKFGFQVGELQFKYLSAQLPNLGNFKGVLCCLMCLYFPQWESTFCYHWISRFLKKNSFFVPSIVWNTHFYKRICEARDQSLDIKKMFLLWRKMFWKNHWTYVTMLRFCLSIRVLCHSLIMKTDINNYQSLTICQRLFLAI